MKQLPIWLNLAGRSVSVMGGTAAAASKARLAFQAGANVTIYAASLESEACALVETGSAQHEPRSWRPEDVQRSVLIFSATGQESSDVAVAEAAREASVLVNVVDRPALSTFMMPAIVDRGAVVVGISTGGTVPALAARIRASIERVLPPRLGSLADFAGSFRDVVRIKIPAGAPRVRFWNRMFDGPIARALLDGKQGEARADMLRMLNEDIAPNSGCVHLVGAGPGDPELLTLKALRLIQAADVLVYDRLVCDSVVAYGRRDAERIFVGKIASSQAVSQDKIHEILVDRARRGLQVVRLKGGDPFIFGRGGEEAEVLRAENIPITVVPGVSAAMGCAAAAGLPLTYRGKSRTVTLATGHASDSNEEPDWEALARIGETLVVYMGVANASVIANKLIAGGRDSSTPVAVIERGTLPEQRVFRDSLGGLGALVRDNSVDAPAVLVIGEMAAASESELDIITLAETG